MSRSDLNVETVIPKTSNAPLEDESVPTIVNNSEERLHETVQQSRSKSLIESVVGATHKLR